MSSFRAAQGRTSLSISQNFLTSRKTVDRLLTLARLSGSDTVVEIGAGKGHLTRALSGRCGKVLAWELDAALADKLKQTFCDNPAVRIIHQDFLKASLPRGPYKVFANIPFSLTTAIVKKLTQGPSFPDELFLIMEKGAAKRFLGLPKENAHSLAIKPLFDAEIVYYFAREEFHPAPRVDVVMVRLTKKQQPDVALSRLNAYRAFIERGLRDGVCGRGSALSYAQANKALRLEGLKDLRESAEMLYVQWLCLFRCAERFGPRR